MDYDNRHNRGSIAGLLENLPQAGIVLADDGRELQITTFEPVGPVVAVAVVASAMATPARFYAAFARRLAEHGVRTITFDYRTAVGGAREMRVETANLDRWIADAAAVLDQVADAADEDGLPVTWIGHSLGGQIIPFLDHRRLAAVVTIASGDGYWRRNAPELRWKVPFLWWVTAPLAIRVTGYFPGRRLGLGGNLPAGVLRQWSRWCRHPEYLQADHPDAARRFAEVELPFHSVSFTDDEVLSADSVEHLNSWYSGADLVHQRVSPDQLGLGRIGHHGFFRPDRAPHWDELVVPRIAGVARNIPDTGAF
jgi:predicted alpha/beta hydrolase